MNKTINLEEIEPSTCSIMRCCLHGNDKSYYLWNNAESYYTKLRHVLDDIMADTQKDYLYFTFVALSSATLEYSLNLLYAFYCFHQFDYEQYKLYLETYKNMRFKNKLFMLPYILSNGKWVINENCKFVKTLDDLIKKRNGLLHNSEKLHVFDFQDIHASIIDDKLYVPIEYSQVEFSLSVEDNIIDTITKENCMDIGNAMFAFYQQILIPFINDGALNICEFIIAKKGNSKEFPSK